MRSLCLLAFGCLAGLIVYTYDLKIKTRALETKSHELSTQLADEGDFLSLMRAEISHLSRPDRIDKLARDILKLEPLASAQVVPWTAVTSGPSAWQPQLSTAAPKQGIAALIERSVNKNPAATR